MSWLTPQKNQGAPKSGVVTVLDVGSSKAVSYTHLTLPTNREV